MIGKQEIVEKKWSLQKAEEEFTKQIITAKEHNPSWYCRGQLWKDFIMNRAREIQRLGEANGDTHKIDLAAIEDIINS